MAEPDVVHVDAALTAAFRELGFDEHAALLLALNRADQKVVKYRLECCGMSLEQAVAIYA